MKKIFLFISLLIIVFLTAGCGQKNNQPSDTKTSIKGDVGNDICAEFPADFIYSVIKKTVQGIKPSMVGADQGCQYDLGNNEFVAIYFENLNVENNKKAQLMMDRTLSTDANIKMEHYIVWSKNNIDGVYLVINPNRFSRIDRSSSKIITNEQNIELAARVADKLQNNLNIKIEKNPIDLAAAKEEALGVSHEQIVKDFLQAIADKNIDKALDMMEADQNTKQA